MELGFYFLFLFTTCFDCMLSSSSEIQQRWLKHTQINLRQCIKGIRNIKVTKALMESVRTGQIFTKPEYKVIHSCCKGTQDNSLCTIYLSWSILPEYISYIHI